MDKQARYKELWDKKWKNLTGDEKVEYQSLGAELGDAKVLFAEEQPQKEERMSFTKEELQKMIAEAIQNERNTVESEQPKSIGTWMTKGKEKDRELTAKLRIYRKDSDSPEGLIVDYKFHKNEWDEATHSHNNPIYKITVRYPGGRTEVVELPLVQIAGMTDAAEVRIIKKDKTEQEMSQGYVRRKPTRDGYIMSGTVVGSGSLADKYPANGSLVELTVTRDNLIYTVQTRDGEKITLPASKLNQV